MSKEDGPLGSPQEHSSPFLFHCFKFRFSESHTQNTALVISVSPTAGLCPLQSLFPTVARLISWKPTFDHSLTFPLSRVEGEASYVSGRHCARGPKMSKFGQQFRYIKGGKSLGWVWSQALKLFSVYRVKYKFPGKYKALQLTWVTLQFWGLSFFTNCFLQWKQLCSTSYVFCILFLCHCPSLENCTNPSRLPNSNSSSF